MNKTVVGSVVAVVVLAVGVVFAANSALSGNNSGSDSIQSSDATASAPQVAEQGEEDAGTAAASARPACPAGPIAGVELDCLGGQAGGQAAQIQIVNVWAWWCEPCRTEMPLLAAVASRHPEWQLVGVHADRNGANGAAFLDEIGVDMPSYQDGDNTFAGTLGLPGVIPITLVVKDGQVRGRIIKAMETEQEIEDSIEEYLS